ncbi:hypothetical protein DFP72DRAFT_1078180 [Ephemerocybe angulata]|uniref:Uncharacterized protein n=1 Tax=Ephemerocybe angulata TaxID=980116 RepID=A0A8H6HEC0_9AGAR|nr:hypothetical protein DFP72DRAFT_1078180 [Tulosesus angulatus]
MPPTGRARAPELIRAALDTALRGDPPPRTYEVTKHTEELLDSACDMTRFPDIAHVPPFNFTPSLEALMHWIWPVCGLLNEEDREEFWRLLHKVIDVWDDVPYFDNRKLRTVGERRLVLVNIIEYHLNNHAKLNGLPGDMYIDLPWGANTSPHAAAAASGDWRNLLDIEVHRQAKMHLIIQSLDPNFRLAALRRNHREQMRTHLEMRRLVVCNRALRIHPCFTSALGTCDCFELH